MPRTFLPRRKTQKLLKLPKLFQPMDSLLPNTPPLAVGGNKPFVMDFEQQLKALIIFHLEEHVSGRHLLQALETDDLMRQTIGPIKKSTFFEAINHRGLDQMMHIFQGVQAQAANLLPKERPEWGDLVAIDGSLIDAVLSMHWANYRKGSKKAKVHVGFNLNQSIPAKIFLTDGKGDERPFADLILNPGQTAVMDRYFQHHQRFDDWHKEGKFFVCRIRTNTIKTLVKNNAVQPGGNVFYDALVLLGTPSVNQTQNPFRLVGYRVGKKDYWVATNRSDLSAEDIAAVYKLRWDIENFFRWWKRHLKVYHLMARTQYGLMVQILAGLITYLLLAIYCHDSHKEKVNIKRVRQLRIEIQNEARAFGIHPIDSKKPQHQKYLYRHAIF